MKLSGNTILQLLVDQVNFAYKEVCVVSAQFSRGSQMILFSWLNKLIYGEKGGI